MWSNSRSCPWVYLSFIAQRVVEVSQYHSQVVVRHFKKHLHQHDAHQAVAVEPNALVTVPSIRQVAARFQPAGLRENAIGSVKDVDVAFDVPDATAGVGLAPDREEQLIEHVLVIAVIPFSRWKVSHAERRVCRVARVGRDALLHGRRLRSAPAENHGLKRVFKKDIKLVFDKIGQARAGLALDLGKEGLGGLGLSIMGQARTSSSACPGFRCNSQWCVVREHVRLDDLATTIDDIDIPDPG